jgi:hypothetical protein
MRAIATVLGSLLVAAACGGFTATAPQSPPVTTTETFSGTTRQSSATACGGDSHNFTAQEGGVTVTLLETSDPAGALPVQVCGGGIDNHDCTINQQRVAVGQSVSGPKKGPATQNLKLLPYSCVYGGAFDPSASITYKAQVTYQR